MTKTLEAWLSEVPDYQRFYTVDEMYANAEQVAQQHPDLAKLQIIGHSTDGQAIPMLSIGSGAVPLLFYACPHPNEPIGAMLIQFLLHALIESPELRGDYTWHLIPCIDPDGTRLNEGWFSGPFTVRHYAQEFYRPPGNEQVEWTFPIDYKDYHFHRPIPETRALMAALEQVRPAFVYSLHNAGFGGVYYYLSRDVPQAHQAFTDIPATLGLFLSVGEPESPWAVEFAPAIFKNTTVAEAYDYYEKYTDQNPVELLDAGGSCVDFLESLGGELPLSLITELPYFQAASIADQTLTTHTRRELLLEGVARSSQISAQVAEILERIQPEMTLDTRLYRAYCGFHQYFLKSHESSRQAIVNDEETLQLATVAQKVDALYVSIFYQLIIVGMLRRAIALQHQAAPSENLAQARDEVAGIMDHWLGELEQNLDYSSIPIRKTVQMQLAALLVILPLI